MKGKKKILAILAAFFVFVYGCWVVSMSIYTENMPVVKTKGAIKTALTYTGTIISYYHRAQTEQECLSLWDGTIEKVYITNGQEIGVGTVVIKYSLEGLDGELDYLKQKAADLTGEQKEKADKEVALLEQVIQNDGALPAQKAWLDIKKLVETDQQVYRGTPLYSGTAAADQAYLSWDLSANDAIYFERGTIIKQVQLNVWENKRSAPKKFDLRISRKHYDEENNRYIYQMDLPKDVEFSIVEGTVIPLVGATGQGKDEHGGVIPLSAVTFDETDVTFFIVKERARVWGTEYYVEEVYAAAEEVAGGLVALTYFPSGGQVVYETDKPLKHGQAVRIAK